MASPLTLLSVGRVGIVRGAGALSALAFSGAVAATLGAAGAGQFLWAFTIVTALSQFTRFGFASFLIRFASPLLAAGDDDGQAPGMLRLALIRSAALSIVTAGLVGLGALALDAHAMLGDMSGPALAAMAAALLPMTLLWVVGGALKAAGRPASANAAEALVVPLSTSVCLVAVSSWSDLTPVGAAAVFVVVSGLAAIGAVTGAMRVFATDFRVLLKTPPYAGAYMPYCVSVTTSSFSAYLVVWLPFILLGYVGSASETGLFGVVFRLAMTVNLVSVVVNSFFAPRFSTAFSTGGAAALKQQYLRSVLLNVALLAFPACVLFFFAGPILALFGPEFAEGACMLRWLLAGLVLAVAIGPADQALMMAGGHAAYHRVTLFILMCSAALAVTFIPDGGVGAAVMLSAILPLALKTMGLFVLLRRLSRNGVASGRRVPVMEMTKERYD